MTDLKNRLLKAERGTLLRFLSQLIHELTVKARSHYGASDSYVRLTEVNETIHRVSGQIRDLVDEREPMTGWRAELVAACAEVLFPAALERLVLWSRV